MPRKKKKIVKAVIITLPSPIILGYYVYYNNKTGQILSITNEVDTNFENVIEVSHDDIAGFFNGEKNWHDYIVAIVETSEGVFKTQLVTKYAPKYDFKNNDLIHIRENFDDDADLTVIYNGINSCWEFSISQGSKQTFPKMYDETFLFFVTLENDFDFLVRTIEIRSRDLFSYDVKEPFNSNYENKKNYISISTVNIFRSYNLKVYEQDKDY